MSDPVVRGRPEAAAVVLVARGPSEAERTRALRRSGVARAIVAFVAAGVLFWLGRIYASAVAGTLGTITLGLAVLSPTRGYVALRRAVDRLGEGVGTLLSWLLLAPVFFSFFAPFGLLGRRGRGDRIGRSFDRSAASYWTQRPDKSKDAARAELERPY